MTSSPFDTSKHSRPHWLFGGDPTSIEQQEKKGQEQVLKATTLPTSTRGGGREAFEALGFKFGKVVEGDPLFTEATLPEGWERKGSDHSMWTYIVDERGIERVSIFYKAAFYDRDAFMSISNVGAKVARDYIYTSDADAAASTLTDTLPKLTHEELEDVYQDAKYYVEDAEKYPPSDLGRVDRARKILEILEEK